MSIFNNVRRSNRLSNDLTDEQKAEKLAAFKRMKQLAADKHNYKKLALFAFYQNNQSIVDNWLRENGEKGIVDFNPELDVLPNRK